MKNVIDFKSALASTGDEDRALLIGNGFSSNYFKYKCLLEKSELLPESPVRKVFDKIGTVDFEVVVRALEGAADVEVAYGHAAHAEELRSASRQVREALITAINSTHPRHREDISIYYNSASEFLKNFSNVFSVNYDLLLYWIVLEECVLKDGFGKGEKSNGFIGPFSERAYCHLYNLHGGLHLFEDALGRVVKALDSGSGVIDTIGNRILDHNDFPIYVAEGSSDQKMRRINSNSYLRHCYEKLQYCSATLFIYGHSAREEDSHIYRAIFKSKIKHIYFGIYQPNMDKICQFDGLLAKYQKTVNSKIEYTFYDSESAGVWEA